MTELEDAMQAVDEWAEKRCGGCRDEASFPAEVIRTHPRWVAPHTCHETEARAKRLAVAVIAAAPHDLIAGAGDVGICDAATCRTCRLRAELDRQWPEEGR